jgi:hypothetical protein
MTRRAGGWILGLLVVGAMGGGGWFALRRSLQRETVVVRFLPCGRDPTDQALVRGAEFALQEAEGRAGRFRVAIARAGAGGDLWIGTSGALTLQGDQQTVPFFLSVVDTHPVDAAGHFRISPGCDRQGKAAAAWAKKAGAARVFLLRDRGSLRSEAIADAFQFAAREHRIAMEGPVDSSTERPVLQDRILASRADLLFYSGEEAPYGTAYALFASLRALGFAGTFLMAEADPEVSFLATRPDLLDGTYLVSPFAPAPVDVAARMGITPGPHVTAGYYAMKAALDSIDRADSVEKTALERVAMRLSSFDAGGRATRPCALYVARNGVFEFVELLEQGPVSY